MERSELGFQPRMIDQAAAHESIFEKRECRFPRIRLLVGKPVENVAFGRAVGGEVKKKSRARRQEPAQAEEKLELREGQRRKLAGRRKMVESFQLLVDPQKLGAEEMAFDIENRQQRVEAAHHGSCVMVARAAGAPTRDGVQAHYTAPKSYAT